MFLAVVGPILTLITIAVTIWFLNTVKEIRDEIRTVRRYLQALYDERQQQR